MDIGTRVHIKGTQWEGVISHIEGPIYIINLDNGIEIRCKEDCITPLQQFEECNTTVERDNSGKFVKGHKKIGGSKKGSKNTIRNIRKQILDNLDPYISDIGKIIGQIDAPEEKVLAMTRLMKFCVPTYSSVQYSEITPRSLTAEEKLAQLNAKYNDLPDPTIHEEDNDEE